MKAHERIAKIADTSSKRAKEELVQEGLASDPLFKKVVLAALNPFVTYGMTLGKKEMAFANDNDAATFSVHSEVWNVLDQLAARDLTGNAAKEAIKDQMGKFARHDADLIFNIINRDLRAGFTAGTVNRVAPGTIPVFDVMLAHKFDEKRIKTWPVSVEPKLDGVRVICLIKDRTVEFLSRTGKPFPALDHLKNDILAYLDALDVVIKADFPNLKRAGRWHFVLDGEVTSGSFNDTVGSVRRKDDLASNAFFTVFEILPLEEFSNGVLTGDVWRRLQLIAFMEAVPSTAMFGAIERHSAKDVEEILALYGAFRERGLEGAIVKPRYGLYEQKRSYAWMKMKNEETIDVPVTGWFEGAGKYERSLGGLIVNVEGVEVRVGGGFSDAQRQELWTEIQKVKGDADYPLGRIIEVEFHEKTPDGSLRHPRFIRFRPDKDE